jgi:MOSC domain-containing protein
VVTATAQLSTLSQINIYPVKSTAGIALTNSTVDAYGLAFDRRFVLTDMAGMFITGRTQPKIALIQSQLTMQGLQLTAPNMPPLTMNYRDFSRCYQQVQVWKDSINSQYCSITIDMWFSDYLDLPCQLLYFGENSQRQVKNSNKEIAFADGYPLLLISQASLDDLNQRLTINNSQNSGAQKPITMQQFRPNLVVNNTLAFAEDSWQRIRIGEVEFEVVKPCSRCIFTTVDPDSGEKHPQQEPLTTLKKYRFDPTKKEIIFGQNLIALNQGKIQLNDKVEILTTQIASIYIDHQHNSFSVTTNTNLAKNTKASFNLNPKKILEEKLSANPQPLKKVKLLFDSWDKSIVGNNQQNILEQGENAGMILAHSCRAGMCGRCKVKLESGEVEQLAVDGLDEHEKQQGYILACSCVPKSDVVISNTIYGPSPIARQFRSLL